MLKSVFIITLAKSVCSCDPKEFKAANFKGIAPIFFVHTIHEAQKGSLELTKLFRMFGFKEHDLKMPFVFDSNIFRPAQSFLCMMKNTGMQ